MICDLKLIVENHAQVRHRRGERYRVQLQFYLIDVDLWQLLARSDPTQLGFVGVHFESVWLHPTVDLLNALRELTSCDRWFAGWYTEMHLRIISVWVCYQSLSVDDFEQLGSVQQEKERAENRTLRNAEIQSTDGWQLTHI